MNANIRYQAKVLLVAFAVFVAICSVIAALTYFTRNRTDNWNGEMYPASVLVYFEYILILPAAAALVVLVVALGAMIVAALRR